METELKLDGALEKYPVTVEFDGSEGGLFWFSDEDTIDGSLIGISMKDAIRLRDFIDNIIKKV